METKRRDRWWIQPLVVLAGFLTFVIYSTWAAFQGANYFTGGPSQLGVQQLLSPFYSPVIWDAAGVESGHAWMGPQPLWWPAWMIFSPALLILPFPGLFRFTCYYYRGAYYKAFWGDPVSCSVGEPKFRGDNYRGEQKFPLVLQNVHRYALYIAILFIFLLGWRHLVGGKHDCMSCSKVRQTAYSRVSWLNERHMLFAWMSLFWVGFSDVYVRLCASGVWTDWRILG